MGDIRAGLEDLKFDGALFAKVKYYVSGEGDPKILNLLQEGGAERSNYFSDFVTHLIAGNEALENDISEAKELYDIPAVTQNWILYSVKCNKLLPTQYFSPEENQLFSNICVCLSQVSRADSKSLWAMITLQGGKCQLRLDRYCTHLVAAKANGVKYEAATRHHIPVVTPDWITECCKKGTLVNEVEYHPRLLVSPNSSTAMITGFMDEDTDNNVAQEEQDRTKAMLEQLKQRMPWNQPSPPVSSSASHSLGATSTVTVPYSTNGQNTANIQPQPHVSRSVSSTNLSTSTVAPSVSDQDVNQTNWLPQTSQQNNISQQIKTAPSQMQQQELSPQQQQQQQQQQQINMQHQLIQQQQLTSQQQLTQQQLTQHQQQLQQPSYNQQQLLNQQQSPQIQQQQLVGQQQSITPQQQQQSINSQLPQHQLNTQQQQLLTPQQKQLNQHQIIQQQQLQTQQPHLTQQQQQVQLAAQQQQQQQQIVMQQQQQQQLPSQQQQIAGQHQLTQQQTPPQQLTPEQRQLILLQQQQQQQKIQQISQQLQQSAPQNSQQFVIRDGQLQQQPQNQQLIGPNQQGFIVQRDSQWQQQQYHLQLQRQQQQQQIGPQRSGGQWNQQPPQPPRQLIHLDAQTHQQLQQMDPQQRAQFIQRIQKHRILQRQVQNRPGQQGSHIAVIRSPGKPVQPGNLQWVQQARPQMMGPQLAQTPGQKPVHPGVQPPALAPINSSNQVIVSAGQAVQGPQVSQTGQPFQQGQLIPQQLAQLQLQQKQQQMVRLQQLQHLQQQQQQQGAQQEPSLTSLPNNAQIPPDQQLVVNAKTKTALANMLTNRLQGAAEGSAAGQLRLMTAQHRPPPPPSQDPQLLAAYQRRTLGNITNGAPPGIKMQYAPVMPQPKAQFYGHNPNLKLPPELFLLGCIFVIVEYDVQRPDDIPVWKQVIERHGGEVESQYCTRATHVLAITQKHPTVVQALREGKRCVSAHWLSDVVSKQQVIPPWQVLHFPTPFSLTELPCGKHIISLSGFEGEERAKVKIMLEALGAKYTNYFSRHNTLLVCRRPEGQKYKRAREWQTAVVNAQWLIDLLCGQMNALHQLECPKYQQFSLSNPFKLDYSLVPHLMVAWKMPINISQESYDKVKQVGQGPNSIRKHKKPRLDGPLLNKDPHLLGLEEPIVISNPDPPPPDKQPRILFSGINPKNHAKRIRELGGALAASWRDATHLVMSAPLRTVKLLCCLSRCKFIVSLQWLLECSAKNTFVDESTYVLSDPEFEKNFNCNIEKTLTSPNRGTVLKGKIFYVTPSVIPSPSAIAEIIESAGGTMEKTRRTIAQIQELNAGKLSYIIVTHDNDLHLLADVLRANINVYSAEIVLGAVARQYFQPDAS